MCHLACIPQDFHTKDTPRLFKFHTMGLVIGENPMLVCANNPNFLDIMGKCGLKWIM